MTDSRSEIRAAKREVRKVDAFLRPVRQEFGALVDSHRDRINRSIANLEREGTVLEVRSGTRRQWLSDHPETVRRLRHLDIELDVVKPNAGADSDVPAGTQQVPDCPQRPGANQLLDERPAAPQRPRPAQEPDLGLGL